MHELAHIICGHEFRNEESHFQNLIELGLRLYNKEHELEAEVLGSTLQIPRSGLLKLLRTNKSKKEIAENYKASEALVQFRINSTGVSKQIGNFNFKNGT